MLSATLATCILYDNASPLLFIPAFRGRRERRKICDGDKKKISCRKPQFCIVAALLAVRKQVGEMPFNSKERLYSASCIADAAGVAAYAYLSLPS